jgi:hypothetical protein
MFRSTMFRTLAGGLAAGSLLVLAACGGDLKASVSSQTPITTVAPGGTSGPGTTGSTGNPSSTAPMGTNPASGTSDNCLKFATQWAAAIGGAMAGQTTDAGVFDALVGSVPDSLKPDAKLLAKAYTGYFAILKKFNGDYAKAMADPDVQKAIAALGTPELNAAQDRITKYFDAQCPKG